jgi:lipoprotein-anchoring transpeptidase ErfK/SrfK
MRRGLRVGGVIGVVVALILVAILDTRSSPSPPADASPVLNTTTSEAPATTTTEAPTTTTTAPPVTEPPGPPGPNPGPPVFPTITATALKASTPVYAAPNGGIIRTLTSPLKFSNGILTFKVIDEPMPGWLHVDLATRPNGSTGYVRKTDVKLATYTWSIDVDLTAHWITVYQGPDTFLSTAVVIGTQFSPTPVGDYFVTEVVREVNPGGPHGPYIFGLSAHSDVFTEFDGGDGQVGIHGTNAPWLMGTSSSNGCVRLDNASITKIGPLVPPGTPVRIHN